MVVDTSALITVLFEEPGHEVFQTVLSDMSPKCMSAVTLLEASMVAAGRRGARMVGLLDTLVQEAEIEVVPFDRAQAGLAREAFLRFGKGRHRAGLNFGDCASHALAELRGAPLLFRGDDFTHTDLVPAIPAPQPPA